MSGELPSEKLRRGWTWKQWLTGGAIAVALVAGGTTAAIAAPTLMPHPKPTPTLEIAGPMDCDGTVIGQGTCITATDQATANGQEQAIEEANAKAAADAAAAAQAAADAAAQQAAQQHAGQAAGAPGSRVPFVKSDDPQNANGGDYVDPGTYCQSGSASTVGGVPVCD